MSQLPELRPITAEEWPAVHRAMSETFTQDARDSERDNDARVVEFDRTVVGFDGGAVVSTAGIFSRQLTVPGNEVPFAAVTAVTVSPTHRRRGVLTESMRRLFADVRERDREAVAGLWASEAPIYGRFGYGMATPHCAIATPKHRLSIRDGYGRSGRIRLLPAEVARPLIGPIHDRARATQVGWLDRSPLWWDWLLNDPEDVRFGATALRYAVHDGADGPDGYVIYRLRDREGEREVAIYHLVATDPEATAALWRFVLELDLVGRISRSPMPIDDPIQQLVTDRRALQMHLNDGLWLRLVDVPRALAERRYSTDVDVVVEVRDGFCPWNDGRFRLSGGPTGAECTHTTDAADLTIEAADLGAGYLGGVRLTEIAAAGRLKEHRPGALRAATRAFVGDGAPWCPDDF